MNAYSSIPLEQDTRTLMVRNPKLEIVIDSGFSIQGTCTVNARHTQHHFDTFKGGVPPRGQWMDYSVGDYVDNSFTALGSSDSREVRFEL